VNGPPCRATSSTLSRHSDAFRCRQPSASKSRDKTPNNGFDAFKLHDALQSVAMGRSDRRVVRGVRIPRCSIALGSFFRRGFVAIVFLYRARSVSFDASLVPRDQIIEQLTRTSFVAGGRWSWPVYFGLSPHWLPRLRLPGQGRRVSASPVANASLTSRARGERVESPRVGMCNVITIRLRSF